MFGIKSKTQLKVEARLYAESMLCILRHMTGKMSRSEDQALAEIFGGVYMMYLCRESADFKHIRPYLAEEFLGQTKHFHCAPADTAKRVTYINACFDAYESAEKTLLKQKKNPIEGLLQSTAANGLKDLLQSDPAYPALWKQAVNRAIAGRKLASYQPYAYPETAAPAPAAPKPISPKPAAPSPAPKADARRMTLMGPDGKPVEYQIIDTIAYQNETYVCLRSEKTGESLILRVLLKPDGSTAYANPGPVIADIIMELAKKRNPLSNMPGKKDAPKTIRLRNAQGRTVEFQVMDIIPYLGRTFVCLLGEGDDMLTVLETKDLPDGSASYDSVDDHTAEMIFSLFTKRNPDLVG